MCFLKGFKILVAGPCLEDLDYLLLVLPSSLHVKVFEHAYLFRVCDFFSVMVLHQILLSGSNVTMLILCRKRKLTHLKNQADLV